MTLVRVMAGSKDVLVGAQPERYYAILLNGVVTFHGGSYGGASDTKIDFPVGINTIALRHYWTANDHLEVVGASIIDRTSDQVFTTWTIDVPSEQITDFRTESEKLQDFNKTPFDDVGINQTLRTYLDAVWVSDVLSPQEKSDEIHRVQEMIEDLARSPSAQHYDWNSFNPSDYSIGKLSRSPVVNSYYTITPSGSEINETGISIPKIRHVQQSLLTDEQVSLLESQGYDVIPVADPNAVEFLRSVDENNKIANSLLNGTSNDVIPNVEVSNNGADYSYGEDQQTINNEGNQTGTVNVQGQVAGLGILLLMGLALKHG